MLAQLREDAPCFPVDLVMSSTGKSILRNDAMVKHHQPWEKVVGLKFLGRKMFVMCMQARIDDKQGMCICFIENTVKQMHMVKIINKMVRHVSWQTLMTG